MLQSFVGEPGGFRTLDTRIKKIKPYVPSNDI